ncbi:DNA-binding response regulator, NarL family (REC-HTH domains) [Methylacidimicrobium sp. AP8]|uniref:response regulator n=1 Tax=Methylacidimicrobium sp. AP8 TaxID=2730359 RepID=UPI0018BFF06B|nr:response regulator transcription factor [Methylacidimicrobium sp. AP8]CAB4243781.1 DNA-binding response regulator, NarL family (REC-HTH domains) [Methylacidimicrobium sp. AP8]
MNEPKGKSGPPKKVLIVDDHALVSEGIAQLIGTKGGLTVCGTAATAREGFDLVTKTKPDLVIVDLSLPGKSGLELIKDIHAAYPEVAILTLSMHEESMYAERALRAGARGYLMKSEGGQRLLEGIQRVLEGGIFVSESVASRVLERFSGRRAKPTLNPVEALSDREFEVFLLIGRGFATRQIAEQLHLSVKTVEAYRGSLKEKLKLASGPELVHYAISWQHSQAIPSA